MEERIKELANKAGAEVKIIHGDILYISKADLDIEKFAELIVRECIGCCEQVISDPVPESVDTWLDGGEQCIQEIKEHFGIEE